MFFKTKNLASSQQLQPTKETMEIKGRNEETAKCCYYFWTDTEGGHCILFRYVQLRSKSTCVKIRAISNQRPLYKSGRGDWGILCCTTGESKREASHQCQVECCNLWPGLKKKRKEESDIFFSILLWLQLLPFVIS